MALGNDGYCCGARGEWWHRVSIGVPSPRTTVIHDASTRDQMVIVEESGVLGFWNDPGEDIYDGND